MQNQIVDDLGSQSLGLVITNTSNTGASPEGESKVSFSTDETRFNRLRASIYGTTNLLKKSFQRSGIKYKVAFITLTYRDGEVWEPKDISKCLNNFKMWASRRNIPLSGVWVLERGTDERFTKRIHYHLLLFLPRGITPPFADKQGWWTKGSSNSVWSYSPVGYMAKYCGKLGSHIIFPARARLHGFFGLTDSQMIKRRWLMAPKWVRDVIPFEHGLDFIKGWWRDRVTGIEYKSPWVVDRITGKTVHLLWLGWSPGENLRFT
jgi:hypothetical protein